MPAISRNVAIVLTVVLLHVALIYAMYSGLLKRAVELVVPVVVMSQLIEPPNPKELLPPPRPPTPTPTPTPLPLPSPPAPTQIKKALTNAPMVAAPLPVAINDPTSATNAPTGAAVPQPAPAPAPITTPAATTPVVTAPAAAAPVATAPVAAAAPPAVQLPSSDADYLQNPSPPYPAISRRLNEQGKTIVRVLIGADGQPQRAEIGKSSGFARLDEAAMATVMRWRYVPGKRGGVADAMWFNVPINWVLE